MGYIIPSIETLIDGAAIVKMAYHANKKNHHPERLALLDTLEVVANLIDQLHRAEKISHEVLREILLGFYFFCLENVGSKYKVWNPQYREGYFFHSGSLLYKLLLQPLDLNETNQITETEKLIYISKSYHFIFNERQLIFPEIERSMLYTIQSVFDRVAIDANRLISAIPTEKMIDLKMGKILERYLAKARLRNAERIFLAQLVQFVSDTLASKPDANSFEGNKNLLTQTQKIKMGLLLYIVQSIALTYLVRTPKKNSLLYDLSCEALNIEHPDDIDDETKLECLSAFELFTGDIDIIKLFEIYMNQPVHSKVHQLRLQLNERIDILAANQNPQKMSSMTLGMAGIGALMMAPPSYGLGYAFGVTVSQTNVTTVPKIALANMTGYVMKVVLGQSGGYLGYFASNMILDATLIRAFAKLFELFGMMIGAATGGVMSLIIYELSLRTLKELCDVYRALYPILTPNLASNADLKLLECLLSLPVEIFSEEKKNKLPHLNPIEISLDEKVLTRSNKGL